MVIQMMVWIRIISWLLIVSKFFQCIQITGKCGFPGLPFETQIDPKKTVYEDGEEVRYSCPNDAIYVKTQVKVCKRGQWTGPRSTCGNFVINRVINVKVVDLDKNETIIDKDTSNDPVQDFPASYFDGKGTRIVINDPKRPHQWYLYFNESIQFDFFLLNIRIPRSSAEVPITEIDEIRVRDVIIHNGENRTCSADFVTRQNKYAKVFWFWCTQSEELDNNYIISFITYSNRQMNAIGLHQVYFTKLQYCGEPPVPLFAKYLPHIQDGNQVVCDTDIAVDIETIGNFSDSVTSEEFVNRENCIDNQYWTGNPKCVPKAYCKSNHNHISETVVSVRNALILNESEWIAIDGTTVQYECNPGFEFVTDSVRKCFVCPQCDKASWDQMGPICRVMVKSNSLTSSQVIGIAFSVTLLIIIVIIIITVVVLKLRKIKSRNFNDINERQKSVNFYDDIRQTGAEEYADYNYGNNDYYDNTDYQGVRYDETAEPKMLQDNYYLTVKESKDKTNDQNKICKETSL